MAFSVLTLKNETISTQRLVNYILIAYCFSLAVRTASFWLAKTHPDFWYGGHMLPIWSPDAGLYGFYAKQLLAGHAYAFDAEHMPGHLIAAFVRLTGVSIDWAMFWLPGLLSSLVVVPTVLIGHALRQSTVGFSAALILAANANYYTRSHLGYMDTDVLNLLLPWTAVMFWIFTLTRKHLGYAVAAAFALLALRMWYHSSAPILAGSLAGLLAVVLLFYRNKCIGWQALLLAGTAIVPLSFTLTAMVLIALAGAFAILNRTKAGVKPYLTLFVSAAAGAAFFIDFSHYWQRAQAYLDKPEALQIATPHGIYRFCDVLSTVIEASGAPIWHINPLFSGMLVYIVPALLGLMLMVLTYRVLWVATPLLVLGLLSQVAGIRFAMFADPALALGFAYLSVVLTRRFIASVTIQHIIIAMSTLSVVGLMLMNIVRLNPHLQPFYFHKNEVAALDTFAHQSTQRDLVLSWWDFGWPLWYYTGRNNTLIDNGRHGSDTFFVANELLSSSPAFVAGSAKYALKTKNAGHPEIIPQLLRHEDVFDAFRRFSSPSFAPSSAHHAYYLLHRDMLTVLPTLASIADRDPKNRRITRQRQFYLSNLRQPYTGKSPIIYGDTFTLDLRNGRITGNDGATTVINAAVVSRHGKMVAAQQYNPRSPMFLIIYDDTKALYMDGSVFGSFLIQALVLDRYDTNRFKKIADTGIMKIFQVR